MTAPREYDPWAAHSAQYRRQLRDHIGRGLDVSGVRVDASERPGIALVYASRRDATGMWSIRTTPRAIDADVSAVREFLLAWPVRRA